jgi:light-regulated signal transduction histidine kinase (bacteriophytochrome)
VSEDKVSVIFLTMSVGDRQKNTGINLALGQKIVETAQSMMNLDDIAEIGHTFSLTCPPQPSE